LHNERTSAPPYNSGNSEKRTRTSSEQERDTTPESAKTGILQQTKEPDRYLKIGKLLEEEGPGKRLFVLDERGGASDRKRTVPHYGAGNTGGLEHIRGQRRRSNEKGVRGELTGGDQGGKVSAFWKITVGLSYRCARNEGEDRKGHGEKIGIGAYPIAAPE